MWCVGNHNTPHAKQDTNVVVESFHSNMKQIFLFSKEIKKNIITSTMLRAQNIPNSNVLLCFDGEDIAFVTSINHTPKLWTIHVLSYEWPQL